MIWQEQFGPKFIEKRFNSYLTPVQKLSVMLFDEANVPLDQGSALRHRGGPKDHESLTVSSQEPIEEKSL